MVQSENGTLLLTTFQLPYFSLVDREQTHLSVDLECQGRTYSVRREILWTNF